MSADESAAVLRTVDLSVSYGGVRALTDASIEVREGQLVGLIGPNGAGKTTFIDAITGFTRFEGNVTLDGVAVGRLAPHSRSRRGLVRTWQSTELFDDLTVRENLTVACPPPAPRRLASSILSGRRFDDPNVDNALGLLGLAGLAGEFPLNLSQGHRKLVGVARALAAKPRVLCLDEPAAGLDADESQALGQRLRQVAQSGLATLLVDHDMGLVLTVCDYLYVLDFGQMIAEGPPRQVREDPKVIEAYLGSAAGDLAGR